MVVAYEAITDRIQAARQTLGDDRLTKELTAAKLMITIAAEGRQFEQAGFRMEAINEKLKDKGITWVCRLAFVFFRLLGIRAARS